MAPTSGPHLSVAQAECAVGGSRAAPWRRVEPRGGQQTGGEWRHECRRAAPSHVGGGIGRRPSAPRRVRQGPAARERQDSPSRPVRRRCAAVVTKRDHRRGGTHGNAVERERGKDRGAHRGRRRRSGNRERPAAGRGGGRRRSSVDGRRLGRSRQRRLHQGRGGGG